MAFISSAYELDTALFITRVLHILTELETLTFNVCESPHYSDYL